MLYFLAELAAFDLISNNFWRILSKWNWSTGLINIFDNLQRRVTQSPLGGLQITIWMGWIKIQVSETEKERPGQIMECRQDQKSTNNSVDDWRHGWLRNPPVVTAAALATKKNKAMASNWMGVNVDRLKFLFRWRAFLEQFHYYEECPTHNFANPRYLHEHNRSLRIRVGNL